MGFTSFALLQSVFDSCYYKMQVKIFLQAPVGENRRVLLLYGKERHMDNFRIDPKKQFSKRLARWTAVFWFVYMLLLLVLMYLQPDVAEYCFYISIVASVVMMINVISYSINSITEKRIFGMLDKAKIEVQLGPAKVSLGNDGDEDDGTGEGGSNG